MDDEDVLAAAEAALRGGRAGEAQRLLHGVVERNPGNGRAAAGDWSSDLAPGPSPLRCRGGCPLGDAQRTG